MDILQTITELSHRFGTVDYVRGGGGNTSCKDDDTLWVKPSGTTLADLTPETLVALDRKKLARLYEMTPPADPTRREALVKETMAAAALPETPGRASVEAPLHDSLQAQFVVHTHPAIVNGMTCSKKGYEICKTLFPDALWLNYIDPGYTLCMQVRQGIENFKKLHGHEPEVIFLKNHGVVVGADTPDTIKTLHARIMKTLTMEYKRAKISLNLDIAPLPDEEVVNAAKETISHAFGTNEICTETSGMFDYAEGPISPDHIVYARSRPFTGNLSREAAKTYQSQTGYLPHIIAFNNAVFGVASTQKKAALALELARDGALVKQLTEAFGGIDYMTERASKFIEHWEFESYRSKQL
ncbi:MAG: class II aldolase/adducin family protein [Sedimentisphaerales bacterium]|nr:class II aldolase/adducin family protein [Sedimentisphaerales bacterium]